MSRSYWDIQLKTGDSWASDGTLARPNDNLSLEIDSTVSSIALVDGDEAYVTPSTKFIKRPLPLRWYFDDGTIKNKIENYIINCSILKIIDHNGIEYVGKFVNTKCLWQVGQDGDYYDIEATFRIMPAYAGGTTPSTGDAILGEDGGAILDETGAKVLQE